MVTPGVDMPGVSFYAADEGGSTVEGGVKQ